MAKQNVPSKTVNTALDKDEVVLGRHILEKHSQKQSGEMPVITHLAVTLEVLAHLNGFLDQVVEIFGDLRSKTLRLEDTQNLVTSDEADLRNTVAVTELDTDLGGGNTLTSQFDDLFANLFRRRLEPRRRSAAVWQSRRADALSL